ncbi:septum formation initiator family protein [Candidatus Uhrbacteria bacterium]|jgi:cell division protein FtsB|nr:septum formation initiator family protein [Candidatus Uhrbacteria bacterium]
MTSVRKTKRLKKAKLFVVVNVLILFFLLIAFGREYVGNIQIEREIAELQSERDQLEQDQLDTLALIEQLSSEYYLESEARTKQGFGLEGETVFVIQEGDGVHVSERGEEESTSTDFSNPRKWFLYFFDSVAFESLQDG